MKSGPMARWFLLVPALAIGWFLVSYGRAARERFWVLKDPRPGKATITKDLGRGKVAYVYSVDGNEYRGKSYRNREEQKYREARVGEQSPVYYSASHPWVSLLNKPDSTLEGLPAIVVALAMEVFLLITILKPKSNWALDLDVDRK